jgi:hypothetical protein
MTYDPHTALRYAREMARPRLVGSGEDRAVAGEIAARLRQFGYRVEQQPFRFSAAHGAFVAAEVLACLALMIGSLLLRPASAWAAAAMAAAAVGVVALTTPLNRAVQRGAVEIDAASDRARRRNAWRRLCLGLGRRYASENVIASLPAARAPGAANVLLVAHYDSKSQRIPIVVRVACFSLAMAGIALYTAAVFAEALGAGLGAAAPALAALTVAAGAPLLFLDVGNASPGAIDNASGAGTAIHVAECVARRPELAAAVNVRVLITGAEELGVLGPIAYLAQHEPELRRMAGAGGLRILNFDGVGVDADLRLAGGRRDGAGLAGVVCEAAGGLGLRIQPFSMVGLSYDHVPFADRGFDAVSLIAIGRATWAVHTPRDTGGALHPRGFDQAGRVALKVIEALAHTR